MFQLAQKRRALLSVRTFPKTARLSMPANGNRINYSWQTSENVKFFRNQEQAG
jgi:hypothetical protein